MEPCRAAAGGCMHMRMRVWPRSAFMRSALLMRRLQGTTPARTTSAAQQTWETQTQTPAPRPPGAPVRAQLPAPQQTALAVQRRQPTRRQSFSILRSLIMEKQVITRREGTSLGFVQQLYVQPQRLAVVIINLKNDRLPLTPPACSIDLAALQQIGDVLLVQDEQVTRQPDRYATETVTKLVGLEVVLQNGVKLGKVRDFSFNPDTGMLDGIKYDRFGQPLVPGSLISVFSAPIADVTRVSLDRVTLADQHVPVRESSGLLDQAIEGLLGPEQEGTGSTQLGPEYQEWYQAHGQAWQEYYGRNPYTEVAAARQRQLPPPQTQSFQERLQPQMREPRQPAMQRQRQPYASDAAPSRDPRSRRQVAAPAEPPAAQGYQPQARTIQGQGRWQPPQMLEGRRADGQPESAPSAQRRATGRDARARPDNAEARQAISEARREQLLTPDPRQQRIQAPQRQPVVRQPQSVVTRDDGRAWLESEMNPVGRR